MRASDSSVSAGRTSRSRHVQQLHTNEIDLDDFVFQSCNLDEHNKTRELSTVWIFQPFLLSFNALHFLFFALMARLSSVGFMSKIPVLNVSFNRQDVIFFVKQSDSIAAPALRQTDGCSGRSRRMALDYIQCCGSSLKKKETKVRIFTERKAKGQDAQAQQRSNKCASLRRAEREK